MRSKLVVSLIAVAFVLGACEGAGQKQLGGTLVGAAAGGLLGAQVGGGKGQLAAVAVGTLLGAFIGSEVGKSLDKADQLQAQQAVGQAHAVPIGQTVAWNNPESGNSGTVTPIRDGTNNQTGAYCREYQTTVTVGGKTEEAYGTACRQPDGSWKIVN
ncbi:MAG: RT0821/Lpp0805 family surface protein [Alphaproteobacteria bacterium]